MITKEEHRLAMEEAAELIRDAGLVVSEAEIQGMDIADFGLSNLRSEGAQILSLYDTKKITGRVIALFPYQTEPEHWHISVGEHVGKEETIRVIKGQLRLYVDGDDTMTVAKIPKENAQYYTCRHEVLMNPCDTYTFSEGEKHWFQAGEEPCVFYTMSTVAVDALDPFQNPNIVRKTVIK